MFEFVGPENLLIAINAIFITFGFPAILWFGLIDRRDNKAKLWFVGSGCLAIAVLAVAILQSASWISGFALTISSLLYLESMRREAGRPANSNWILCAIATVAFAVELLIDLLSLRVPFGIGFTAFTTSALNLAALRWLYVSARKLKSRGLVIAGVGILLPSIVSLARVFRLVFEGTADNIFSYAPLANAAVIAFVVGGAMQAIGYMIFSNEKAGQMVLQTQLEIARMDERRAAAEAYSAELAKLMEQREQLIMLSSRFSTVSSLALLNSALLHELSQPLQGLCSLLDELHLLVHGDSTAFHQKLEEAQAVVVATAGIISALKKFIVNSNPGSELINAWEVVNETVAIAAQVISKEGIILKLRSERPNSEIFDIKANRILLGRLIMNLIVNAIEALREPLENQNPNEKFIEVAVVQHLAPLAELVIYVRDNGPGFPSDLMTEGPINFRTTKSEGTGLGLVLGREITQSWGGRFFTSNWNEAGDSGACVEIRLPISPVIIQDEIEKCHPTFGIR